MKALNESLATLDRMCDKTRTCQDPTRALELRLQATRAVSNTLKRIREWINPPVLEGPHGARLHMCSSSEDLRRALAELSQHEKDSGSSTPFLLTPTRKLKAPTPPPATAQTAGAATTTVAFSSHPPGRGGRAFQRNGRTVPLATLARTTSAPPSPRAMFCAGCNGLDHTFAKCRSEWSDDGAKGAVGAFLSHRAANKEWAATIASTQPEFANLMHESTHATGFAHLPDTRPQARGHIGNTSPSN